MSNFTKKAIQESFLKLLNERPLSKITVKDIVADCGINRNTFYYYFEDIPKLIENMVEEDAARIIQTYPTVEKFEDCLEAVIDLALMKKRAVLHIYHSASREIYETYLWKVCDYAINAYVTSVLHGRSLCFICPAREKGSGKRSFHRERVSVRSGLRHLFQMAEKRYER